MSLIYAVALILANPPLPNPDAVVKIAYLDLFEQTPPADQRFTRYLSLNAVAEPQRAEYAKVLSYALNAVSFRSDLKRPEVIAGGLLVKFDLRWYALDFPTRQRRIAELKRRGVTAPFSEDVWEVIVANDIYFQVAQEYKGQRYRGWIDPAVEQAARLLSHSTKFVVRGDWILPRSLQEQDFKGHYSDLLMFPKTEAELYKSFLIDVAAFDRDSQLRRGGAVLESIVALNNRELQLIPSPYGSGGVNWIWKTFDFNEDATGEKSVLENFAGTVRHDGRELLGTLPNGYMFAQLFAGNGDQVAVVPENIAQVKRPLLPVRDTRVISSYKCLECHGPSGGVIGFEDVVRKTFLSQSAILNVVGKDKNKAAEVAAAVEEYYNSELGKTIVTQQAVYVDRLKAGCDMDGTTAAKAVVGALESYVHDLVDPQQAARDMGLPLETARLHWMRASIPYVSGGIEYRADPFLAVLAAGQPVRRAAWEQSFRNGMLVPEYPWENAGKRGN